jgi:hypothetical protein
MLCCCVHEAAAVTGVITLKRHGQPFSNAVDVQLSAPSVFSLLSPHRAADTLTVLHANFIVLESLQIRSCWQDSYPSRLH